MKHAFHLLEGWSTKIEFDGINYGGNVDLMNDWRLKWHIDVINGVENKTCLELGPLEAGHTIMLESAGSIVTAVEGNRNNFFKCLVMKNEFQLSAKFIFGDFCKYVKNCGRRFDFVSAAGVLYHQRNPAELIYNLAKITNIIFVWSQIANDQQPSGLKRLCSSDDHHHYEGKIQTYNNTYSDDNYCGGLENTSFWLYGHEMIRCFKDAGFKNIIQKQCDPTVHGDCILFVAMK